MLCCILQLLHILYINYKCLTKSKRLERLEMSGDPKNRVQARWRCYLWIFLKVVSARRHQSIDPPVPGQPSKALRGCPSLWKVGSALPWEERGGDRWQSYYVSSPSISGSKSGKFVGISTSETNIVETKNVLQHDVRPILNFRPKINTFARLQASSSDTHLCTILE